MHDRKDPDQLIPYINFKLALLGFAPVAEPGEVRSAGMLPSLVAQFQEKERLLANHLCPADQRIQTYLYDCLQDVPVPKLPPRTFVLDFPGMARLLSLPVGGNAYTSSILNSYRVRQGVLHNPRSDRRTTQGIFHVAEGGLPIPDDKLAVPKAVFARLLARAFQPSAELLRLPFTSAQPQPAECYVSMMLRPLVCPEVAGVSPAKSMETRLFAPGGLVSNLDFVENIFGNAGDPGLPENDAALDAEHWTGHTGCIILAPHLTRMTKRELGLPSWDQATPRQQRDGMCWRDSEELYNDGQAFKLTSRDETGVIVTVIADNYYGYCKKEVKTQISYAANLFGSCEEEHAGGAVVFPSYDLGEEFQGNVHVKSLGHTFADALAMFADVMQPMPEGYAVDKTHPDILYVPEDAHFDLKTQRISWKSEQGDRAIKLLAGKIYVRPSGYKIQMEKPGAHRSWRLVGTVAEGTLCHKPSTVSGGGKSEISKPITDAVLTGPVFVADFQKDFDQVSRLIQRDYSGRFKDPNRRDQRPILSAQRSVGSVIKLLTPDERDYTADYNLWLEEVPQYLKELVFVVKRYYKPEWGDQWREHFSVDIINGISANELKCDNRKLVTTYLRVGFDADGSWRTFGLRKDFHPAVKLQVEDDITASVVVPPGALKLPWESAKGSSLKFVQNVERRLFQRPDDAIHRGYDKQAEADFAQPDNFFSNYEPLTQAQAREMVEDAVGFSQFTEPMQALIREAAAQPPGTFFVCSAAPRLVGGKPSKNPRYLQKRPDLANRRDPYLADISARLRRHLPTSQPVYQPVAVTLPGRRNNPPDGSIRSLAVFGPMHYLELPELFMEFICSMTGKSPSTTGAGSEGALTKGPFNALPPIIDLNAALVSWVLTGHNGFITAAGYIGPQVRVDHDISLVVPEVWSRMSPDERDPAYLIANDFLERCVDLEFQGRPVLASRLGYRINARFVRAFFGRVFNHPQTVFTPEMLQPERQGLDVFADGLDNIVTTQRRVAQMYLDDGSVAQACPPLEALLHIMVAGDFKGKGLEHPEIRQLFTREHLLSSGWYEARLIAKQKVDSLLWRRHVSYLDRFLKRASHAAEATRLNIPHRLARARKTLEEVESPAYPQRLFGTLGVQPLSAPPAG